MSAREVSKWAAWGSLADLGLLIASFILFPGSHGPAGPMSVINVLNRPGQAVAEALFPDLWRASELVGFTAMLAVVLVNGAVYGLAVGLVLAAIRAVRRTPA